MSGCGMPGVEHQIIETLDAQTRSEHMHRLLKIMSQLESSYIFKIFLSKQWLFARARVSELIIRLRLWKCLYFKCRNYKGFFFLEPSEM